MKLVHYIEPKLCPIPTVYTRQLNKIYKQYFGTEGCGGCGGLWIKQLVGILKKENKEIILDNGEVFVNDIQDGVMEHGNVFDDFDDYVLKDKPNVKREEIVDNDLMKVIRKDGTFYYRKRRALSAK